MRIVRSETGGPWTGAERRDSHHSHHSEPNGSGRVKDVRTLDAGFASAGGPVKPRVRKHACQAVFDPVSVKMREMGLYLRPHCVYCLWET